MKSSSGRSVDRFAVALKESRHIAAKEADEPLQQWESLSLRVCFAVCMGELARHAHWVGTISNVRLGRWALSLIGPPICCPLTNSRKLFSLKTTNSLDSASGRQMASRLIRNQSIHRQE